MRKGLSDAVLGLVIITAVLLIVNHRQSPTYEMALAQDVENDTIAINNYQTILPKVLARELL